MPRASFSQREAALFFRQARRVVQSSAFDILIAHRASVEPKLLVVTAARTGNAPDRNRIRRRIKAIFHEFAPLNDSYDIAFIIKKAALKLSFNDLFNLITIELKQYAPTPDAS